MPQLRAAGGQSYGNWYALHWRGRNDLCGTSCPAQFHNLLVDCGLAGQNLMICQLIHLRERWIPYG